MVNGQPAWRDALARAGLPLHVVLIDFETFFDKEAGYSMGLGSEALSTIEYVTDPRFEEICHSIIHIRQPFEEPKSVVWWGGYDGYIRYLQDEYGKNLKDVTVVAQNLAFDGLVLKLKYGIDVKHGVDLLGLARHEESRDHNDLESLAERHDLPAKGETKRFSGLHYTPKYDRSMPGPPKLVHRGMTADEIDAMYQYVTRDTWLEWHLFTKLMPRLSNPKVEAALMQHTLEMFWKPTLVVDQVFATELAGKMEARIDEVVQKVGVTRADVSGDKTFGSLLDKALIAAGDRTDAYLKDMKPKADGTPRQKLAIAKDDPQLELLQNHRAPEVRDLINARTAVKSWPLHIARVERIARQAKAAGGCLPNPMKYCGAHTGRWAGGERINTQNLPSRNKEEVINSMRGLLQAPEGHDLVIVDAAQIEARGCDWLAEELGWLKVWQEAAPVGVRDPYCEFAAMIAARPLRKAKKADPPPLKKYLDKMRGMGKVGVLGCGYGMGADKAVAYAENSYGVSMTVQESISLVNTYRKTHPEVCKLWRVIEQKFKACAKYGEPSSMQRGIKFHKEGDITVITLPSTRTLKYPGVKVSIINGREQMWMPSPIDHKKIYFWGGYLVENVVQAFCRDILGEAVLHTEAEGYHVAHHVHDEIIAVVPKTKSKQALDDIIRILSTPPPWAADFPLAAEGSIRDRYGK